MWFLPLLGDVWQGVIVPVGLTFCDTEILMASKLKNAKHMCFSAATSPHLFHVIDFSV